MKVATCTIVRLENIYLIEFVEHYKSIGVDHMFIYDNNIPNTENVTDVLQKYIDDKFVTVINFQDQKEYPMGDAIIKAFTDCWKNNKDMYDWILFLDNDEFLTLVKDNNIKEYLGRDCFKDKDVIRVNWLCYDDNNSIYYEDKPLKERFTHPCKNDPYLFIENYHIKSIIHNTAPDIEFKNGSVAHCPLIKENIKYCDDAGNVLITDKNNKNRIRNQKNNYINYDLAYYAHYRMKTIDEYINNKIKKLSNQGYKNIGFTLNMFFKYNEYSKEKENIYLDYIKNNSKNVIYTILKENDELKDPKVISDNFDYVCFSANHNVKSNIWKIHYIKPKNELVYKEIKFLPHKYLNDYNFCVYVNKSININVDFNKIKNEYIDIPNSYKYYYWIFNNEQPTNIMCRYLLDQSCIFFETYIFNLLKINSKIDNEIFNNLMKINSHINKITI